MNNKILLFLIFFPALASAQKYSISPSITYSTGILSTTWHSTNDHTYVSADTTFTNYSGESTNLSLGAGNRFGFKFENNRGQRFSLGTSLSYFSSRDIPVISLSEARYIPYSANYIKIKTTDTYRNKSIDLGLYSHVQFSDKNLAPYVNTGVIISFSKFSLTREIDIVNNVPGYYPTERYVYEYKISPAIHYGLTGSAGIEINRQKTISLYAELYSVLMKVSPTRQTCRSKVWNSVDQYDLMTESEKSIIYVDAYTEDDNQSTDEPTKRLKYNQSFCSLGLQAGVKIHF